MRKMSQLCRLITSRRGTAEPKMFLKACCIYSHKIASVLKRTDFPLSNLTPTNPYFSTLTLFPPKTLPPENQIFHSFTQNMEKLPNMSRTDRMTLAEVFHTKKRIEKRKFFADFNAKKVSLT
jgi:hypothetical protein